MLSVSGDCTVAMNRLENQSEWRVVARRGAIVVPCVGDGDLVVLVQSQRYIQRKKWLL